MGKSSAARALTEISPEPVEAKEPEVSAETVETPQDEVTKWVPAQRKSAYPEGTKLFSWTPKDGVSEIIELPMEFVRPNKEWLWRQNQLPFLAQTWNWLDRAGTPKSVQLQCVRLPDDEYMELFKAWFQAMGGGATPGE